MFFCYLFMVVSLVHFLHDSRVSSCDLNCADKPVFTPSRVVVKFGDAASASCSVCQRCNSSVFDLEKNVGESVKNGTTISWTVNSLTEWSTSPTCYYTDDITDDQCCTKLPVTVYKPPDNVSISFVNHTGPMVEGHYYTLQCTVQEVAPVENLFVTFYKGQTELGQWFNDNTEKKPVSYSFYWDISPSKEDDGGQYWCKAELQLGPEGPQLPPVVKSQNITASVHYKPQLEASSHPDLITITEGNPLQLNCSALGNPSPSYTWTLPSNSTTPTNSGILTIKSVAVEDKGRYTCTVRNHVGTVTVEFNVDVRADYTAYIVAGALIGAVVIILFVGVVYFHYYKHNRMGQYNLKDVFRLGSRKHSPVSTVE